MTQFMTHFVFLFGKTSNIISSIESAQLPVQYPKRIVSLVNFNNEILKKIN
jgi:hypothetical protein